MKQRQLWLAVALLGAVAGAARAAEPRIEVAKRVIDLGVREPGARLTIDFPIRNAGKAPLEITRVVPSCGCMVPRYDRRLLPGAKGVLRVLFDTAGRHGEFRKNIAVESSDPATPRIVLTLRVLLRRAVEVTPGETITLPTVEGQATESEIVLRSHEGGPLKITRVTCPFPGSETRLLAPEEVAQRVGERPEECRIVRVRFPESAGHTAFDTTVLIETGSPRRPRIPIQVTGVPRAAVSVDPPHLYFGEVTRTGRVPVLRVITLFRRKGDVRVTSVEAGDPHLKITVEADRGGSLADVLAVYEGGWPLGLKRGTITIRTDDPQRPRVRVPYTAEVSEQAIPEDLPRRRADATRGQIERLSALRPLAAPVPPPAALTGSPRVEVGQTEIDLGVVEPGATIPATFALKNVGDAPLRIEAVGSGCGCLVAEFDAEIPPGGTGTIRAKLNTVARQGPIRKNLSVTTNDPRTRRLTLGVAAMVRRVVVVEPSEEVVLPLLKGVAATRTVTLRSVDGQPFRIKAVFSTETELTAEAIVEGGKQAVRLTVPPNDSPGEFKALVSVTLDHPTLVALRIFVSAYPRPAVQCRPQSVTFGDVSAKAPVSRHLILLGAEGLRITGVDLPDPRLRAEPAPMPDGEGWGVRITFRGGGRPGPARGVLTLRTDDPLCPRVQVPYTASIRR